MPNHVHMILWIIDENMDVGQRHAFANIELRHASTLPTQSGIKPKSLNAAVGSFKSAVTKEINELRGEKHPAIWQPRFHDRIIRNERELHAIRAYIRNNPQNWTQDRDYHAGLDLVLQNI